MEAKDNALAKKIKAVHLQHSAYGHRRLAWHLGINPKQTLRVMHKFCIKPPRRKARKHWCTRSTHKHNYTNLIKEITPSRVNEIWVSDISYIKFAGRFWYLAAIEDVFTRQILAARVGKRHDAKLIKTTIEEAFNGGGKPTYFHSDQGNEFMSRENIDLLEKHGVQVSVSNLASPWENGYKESFFGRFKEEFGELDRFGHLGEFIEEIYAQISYYNNERIHTALKVPPAVFAARFSDSCHTILGT